MLAGDHVPDEDGAGVLHLRPSSARRLVVGHHQLQVLGRDGVGHGQGLLGTVDQAGDPGRGQGGLEVGPPGSRPPRCGRPRPLTAVEHIRVPGHQPGQPVGTVLGLDHQVDGGERGRRVGAGDHHDLGGPGEGRRHPDHARHLALGLGHVGVARAGDDVDRGARWRCRRPWRRWPGPRRSGTPRRPRRRRRRTAWRRRPARRRPAARTARCSPTPATRAGAAHMSTVEG